LLVELQCFDFTTLETAFKNSTKLDSKEVIAGYIWNAFGLFFTREIVGKSSFPPAAGSMSLLSVLDSTVWDEFAKLEWRDVG